MKHSLYIRVLVVLIPLVQLLGCVTPPPPLPPLRGCEVTLRPINPPGTRNRIAPPSAPTPSTQP